MKLAALVLFGLLAFVGGRVFPSPAEPGSAAIQPGSRPPAFDSLSPAAGSPSTGAVHSNGDALCIHQDVYPVAKFVDSYYDGIGQHYHGWRPPAGPPFYVQCPGDGEIETTAPAPPALPAGYGSP